MLRNFKGIGSVLVDVSQHLVKLLKSI